MVFGDTPAAVTKAFGYYPLTQKLLAMQSPLVALALLEAATDLYVEPHSQTSFPDLALFSDRPGHMPCT